MNRSVLWRGLLILAVLVAAAFLAFPLEKNINLGLDLQGGMHLVLQVKTEDALRAETDAEMERLIQQAAGEGAPGLRGRRTGDSQFEITGVTPDSKSKLASLADRFLPEWSLQDQPERVVFSRSAAATEEIRRLAVTQAVRTITNRVDQFGVAEPSIQEASNYRIIIQLPGVDDPERVRGLIQNTAFLEFRIVRFPRGGGGGVNSREAVLANFNGRLPDDLEILPQDVRDADGNLVGQAFYAVEKRRQVTGRDLRMARPSLGQYNDPVVQFSLTPTGADKFAELTGANIGEGLAIVLDGKVVSAPVINSQIGDQGGVIEGRFTQKEVQDLSTVLRSGALPAGITYLEERTVGPSLGRDSVENGLRAGLIGTALVVVFMLIIYNLSGFNAVIALAINLLLLMAGLAMFNATLTLPGIAGILLTIGMAVDANVLVFERIREEIRAGRTVRSAIDLGFEKALSSIIDSNVTTLVAALFLFQFGTGPIRGFAVTLTIGLLASMFSAVFVSRWLFDLVLSSRRVQRLSI